MSTDNGIYIAQFDDGYRVIHAQAIENVFSCEDFSEENTKAYIWSYFHNSAIFLTKADAWIKAQFLYKEIINSDFPILEYGVSEIGHLGKMPEMTKEQCEKIIKG